MFYEKFLDLCISRNISPSAAAQEAGFSNAAATDWKNGAKPRKANLKKLANYFNVPVEHFDDEPIERIKKDPIVNDDGEAIDEETLKMAKILQKASPEQLQIIKAFLQSLQSQEEKSE